MCLQHGFFGNGRHKNDVALKTISYKSRVTLPRYDACTEPWVGGSVPLVGNHLSPRCAFRNQPEGNET